MLKNNYYISVVVGTFSNRNEVLDKYAVRSLLNSDYPKDKFEIIIVDSNDNQTVQNDLTERYSSNPQIRIIREPTIGLCLARNRGAIAAKGDIVCYTDDDCEVDPLWLKRMNEFYQDASIMFGGGSIYDTAYKRNLRSIKNDPLWPEERQIPGGNMSFRRGIFKRFRFDENIIFGNDEFELFFRLLCEGYDWYFDETPTLHHRAPSPYRDVNLNPNKKGERLGKNAELYFKFKRKIYARIYPGAEPNWEKREKKRIFFKYFFLSRKKYNLSLKTLEKIVQDINLIKPVT